MKKFLNDFAEDHRDFGLAWPLLKRALGEIRTSIGDKAFVRNRNQINAAQAESVVVGIMTNIEHSTLTPNVRVAFDRLITDEAYIQATGRATADNDAVRIRFHLACEYFSK